MTLIKYIIDIVTRNDLNNIYFMKKLTSYLLIVFALLALIQGQSWRDDPIRNGFNSFEGAQAPHMFSTVIWAENTDTVDG